MSCTDGSACECCGKPQDVNAVWPDGSVTPVDEQTKQRFLALYGEPLVFKFESAANSYRHD